MDIWMLYTYNDDDCVPIFKEKWRTGKGSELKQTELTALRTMVWIQSWKINIHINKILRKYIGKIRQGSKGKEFGKFYLKIIFMFDHAQHSTCRNSGSKRISGQKILWNSYRKLRPMIKWRESYVEIKVELMVQLDQANKWIEMLRK